MFPPKVKIIPTFITNISTLSSLSVNLSTQQVSSPRISSGQRPRTIVSPNKQRGRDEEDRVGASLMSTSELRGFNSK